MEPCCSRWSAHTTDKLARATSRSERFSHAFRGRFGSLVEKDVGTIKKRRDHCCHARAKSPVAADGIPGPGAFEDTSSTEKRATSSSSGRNNNQEDYIECLEGRSRRNCNSENAEPAPAKIDRTHVRSAFDSRTCHWSQRDVS